MLAKRELEACCISLAVTAARATDRLIRSVCPCSLSMIDLSRLTSFLSSTNVRLRTAGVDLTIESTKTAGETLTSLAQQENH